MVRDDVEGAVMNKLLENHNVKVTTVVVIVVFLLSVIVAETIWKTNVARDLREIRNELRVRTLDRWTRTDMQIWVAETERRNRGNEWHGGSVRERNEEF